MYEIAWKEITARGRIVCKRRAFRSESARETYIDQLVQKDSYMKSSACATRCGRGADRPPDVHPLAELS